MDAEKSISFGAVISFAAFEVKMDDLIFLLRSEVVLDFEEEDGQ